ncbi:MAG: DUF835 domain-containing protein [Thermoplasmata archaeon]
MSDPAESSDRPTRDTPRAPDDEEFARAYADGFGEGIRSALKEVLQHVSRGHTAQELRILIESRLARVNEEIELKHKSLLGPPRRPAWGPLLRAPQPVGRAGTPPAPAGSLSGLLPSNSYLVKEQRPDRAIRMVEQSLPSYPRLVVVSLHPPKFSGQTDGATTTIKLGANVSSESGGEGSVSPGEIGGRLRAPTEASGGAIVFLDALEYLVTENGVEMIARFVNWLVAQVQTTGSALVVSLDPSALDLKDLSRLQRAFNIVL